MFLYICRFIVEFITFLLQSIGTYVDPTVLILKIKDGMKIPDLKNSLVKMLNQYNLQVQFINGSILILLTNIWVFRCLFKKDVKKF